MHLDPLSAKRFYRLMNALTLETDRALMIAETPLGLPGATPYDQLAVIRRIADEPELIDDFEQTTNLPLTADDKAILDQWKHLLSGKFLLTGFAKNGNALLETEMGTIELCGITQEIGEIATAPSLIETVIIPFESTLTFGVSIATYPIVLGPNMIKMLEENRAADGKEPIRSPEQFIPAFEKWREEKAERDWQELQHQMRRDYDKAHGTEQMPKGFHRGALADRGNAATNEGVEKRVSAALEKIISHMEAVLAEQAVQGPVRRKLSTALADLSKGELLVIADQLLIDSPVHNMAKTELVQKINDALLEGPESPSSLENQLSLVPDETLEEFLAIVDAGGKVEIEHPDERTLGWAAAPPLVFLYRRKADGPFTFAVMPEVASRLSAVDRTVLDDARALVSEVDNAARICATFYGVISVNDFTNELVNLLGLDVPSGLVAAQLVQLIAYDYPDYDLYVEDDVPYLCDELLTPLANGVEDDSREAESIRAFRRHVLERHQSIGRVPLERIIDRGSCADYALDLESARLLEDWLNAHVPDGADDYRFAEDLVYDIFDSTRAPIDPGYVPRLLAETGALPEEADAANDLLALAMRFVNDIPIWENGGYSPTELLESETGKRVFYNEDGRPKKVGRNDPCPCGSGKKYKKCCGR